MKWKVIKNVYFSNKINIFNIQKYYNVRSSNLNYKVIPIIVPCKVYQNINISCNNYMVLIRLVLAGCSPLYFYLFSSKVCLQ